MTDTSDDNASRRSIEFLQLRVADLHWRWKVFHQLFIADKRADVERVRLMEKWGAGIFALIQDLLLHDVLLRLCKLTDDMGAGPRTNLVLERVLEQAESWLTPAQFSEAKAKFGELRAAVKSLKEWRNKLIAHEDEQTAMGIRQLPAVRFAEISAAVDACEQILTAVDPNAEHTQFMYRHMISAGDGNSLIQVLRFAQAWRNHCLREGKHPNDYPPLFQARSRKRAADAGSEPR